MSLLNPSLGKSHLLVPHRLTNGSTETPLRTKQTARHHIPETVFMDICLTMFGLVRWPCGVPMPGAANTVFVSAGNLFVCTWCLHDSQLFPLILCGNRIAASNKPSQLWRHGVSYLRGREIPGHLDAIVTEHGAGTGTGKGCSSDCMCLFH